jgi:two-component system chemotaxis sensor kinase CheA
VAIDLQQFHQTFFDESLEGLASMEQSLLDLDRREADPCAAGPAPDESLHSIFRVVHSIKGGSGTFGFGWLTDFAHLVETLLDDLRGGRRELDSPTIGLLLRAVDCLRILLDATRTGSTVDKAAVEGVAASLEALQRAAPAARPAESSVRGWRIIFRPRATLFLRGNDPLRILRELARLGEIGVSADARPLPTWREFDPQNCYLRWDMTLTGDVARAALDDVFAWVADDADIEISALAARPGADAPAGASAEAERQMVKPHGTSLRVSTHKMDALLDIVGELVITQTMLQQEAAVEANGRTPRLLAGLAQLERNVRRLQDSVMKIRMLPLGFVLSRLPRMVRDLGEQLEKRVELKLDGGDIELDKTLIERIGDPILHMVRNAMDHGIEPASERRAAGKPEIATIRVEAVQKGGSVILEIEDDGRGLPYEKILACAVARRVVPANASLTPEQLNELVFLPGVTTSESVTDLSGRGVGLDVVRSNIRSLGGAIGVSSRPGQGTRFTLQLPLTLAILDGLGVQVGDKTYLVPLLAIRESLRLRRDALQRLPDGSEVFSLRREYLPLLRLHELLGVTPRSGDPAAGAIVVIEAEGNRVGILVDDLLGQQQVVIKSLETHYRRVEGIAAATILGDGTIALILDTTALVRRGRTHMHVPLAAGPAAATGISLQ